MATRSVCISENVAWFVDIRGGVLVNKNLALQVRKHNISYDVFEGQERFR